MTKKEHPLQVVNKRLLLVYVLIITVFLLLLSRLFYLQVVKGAEILKLPTIILTV